MVEFQVVPKIKNFEKISVVIYKFEEKDSERNFFNDLMKSNFRALHLTFNEAKPHPRKIWKIRMSYMSIFEVLGKF